MMKRILCLILAAVFLSGVCSLTAVAESGSYIRGDADGDGSVTILDAVVIMRRLSDISVTSFFEKAADVDGKGLDITDATRIQRYLASFADPYHIGDTVNYDEYELPYIPS